MADMDRIGIIAGGGQFPVLFARAVAARGINLYTAAYVKEADPLLGDYSRAILWLHLGQLKRLIRFFKKHQVHQAVMMGHIRKTRMFTDVRPDLHAIAVIAKMRHTHDDAVLRAFAGALETAGIRILPATCFLPELLAPAGCWTRRAPTAAEQADIDMGFRIAREIGRLDIGQCVVVGGGSVLAVEAIEGTDAAILRGGNLGPGHAVAVKVCKPHQDTRFDLPAIGDRTIETMRQAGVRALAVEAGRAVAFDREEMIAHADRLGVSIVAQLVESEDKTQDGC
jgi:DUF1009 family protein